jgi:hypothetical protein
MIGDTFEGFSMPIVSEVNAEGIEKVTCFTSLAVSQTFPLRYEQLALVSSSLSCIQVKYQIFSLSYLLLCTKTDFCSL